MACKTYPRETLVFIPVLDLEVDGVPITDFTDVEYVVKHNYERPDADWAALIEVDGAHGFLLDGEDLGIGTYTVWLKVTDAPETPVFEVGTFRVT